MDDEELEPRRAYEGDAGFDLTVAQPVTIRPGEFKDVRCGIAVELPKGTWGFLTGRSSTLRRRGLLVHTGIIDNGYRGELFAGVWNLSETVQVVQVGERIAQLIPLPVVAMHPEATLDLGDSERGEAGFGSTGH